MNYFEDESANDPDVKSAVIKFGFSLSLGNLDEAYKTIINIDKYDKFLTLKFLIDEKLILFKNKILAKIFGQIWRKCASPKDVWT